jgi:SurA N-terminal domain
VPCGNLEGVQIRRLTAATAAGLALLALTGCRTAPNVAAYVGDQRVTVAELEAEVDTRFEDPAVEAAAEDRQAYTRQVLTQLVQDEVHTRAAEQYGVEVSDGDVQDRIRVLLGDDDPAQVFGQLAEQGVSRQDVFSSVRQQLVRLGIAEEEGLAEPLSEEALRGRYEEVKGQSAELEFGYITVPDQRTADQVVTSLQAQPGRYAELAARYEGDYTLPEVAPTPASGIPAPLAEQAAAAAPGTAFAVPVEETGGIVVGFVAGQAFQDFDELRPQLEQQAGSEVEEATAPLIEDVRADLDVEVNPRYGTLQDGTVQPGGGEGVVDILTEG